MKKLNWLFIFFGLLSLVSCETKKSIDQPPNVILIISDQWSTKVSDGSGNYDNGILTPGIDLLASLLNLSIMYPSKGKSFYGTVFSQ